MNKELTNKKLMNEESIMIDNGTYGYVFRPAILCDCMEINDNDKNEYVSKIIKYDDFFICIHNEKLLKKLKKNYFIFSKEFCGLCDIGKEMNKKSYYKLIDHIGNNEIEDYVNMVIPYGGMNSNILIELYDKNKSDEMKLHYDFIDKNFNYLVARFMKLLKVLNGNNIVHCDIKTLNVLFDFRNGITKDEIENPSIYMKRFKIIDYDFVHKMDEHQPCGEMYYVYPPELNIYNFKKNSIKNICTDIKSTMNKSSVSQCQYNDSYVNIINSLAIKFKNKKYFDFDFAQEYNKYIDVYGVGLILLKLIYISPTYNRNEILNKLLTKMTKFNPEERIDIRCINKLINNIKKNEWNLVNFIIDKFDKKNTITSSIL